MHIYAAAIASVFFAAQIIIPEAAVKRSATLAETGHCKEALPQLKNAQGHIANDEMKRRVGVAGVRCSMTVKDAVGAASFLSWLLHEFPRDPAVLYLASHVYSDLSIQSSNELLATAPGSPQVHELNAEALETMGKWKEAADEYRAVLSKEPGMAGIHYRLGRLMLSMPNAQPTVKEDARKEFEDELKVDPANAGANFVLGELARQAERWPEAIAYFSKASTLDTSFVDAFIGLGRAYLAAGKPAEATAPLETAAKLQPDSPLVHFELATAYRRAGRKDDAAREFQAHKLASEKASQTQDEIKNRISR